MPRTAWTARSAVALMAVATLAGCSSSTQSLTGPPAPAATAGGPLDLRGTCPGTVVVQEDWQPEAEYGGIYQLLGANRTIDTSGKRVSGPLIAQGQDTGVQVEIRTSPGTEPVASQMAVDPSITLGTVSSDQALVASAKQPVVTVVSTMTTSPQIIMWDPASHPGATTIQQAAASGVPVLTSGKVIPALLEAQRIMAPTQQDTSYDGTPARFVADPRILQQGYATTEPYNYQHEIRQWSRPIAYQKLSDVGYNVYAEPLAVPAAHLAALRPCLSKLVPILQRAQVDYVANPAPTDALMVDLVNRYQAGWTYSSGTASYASQQLKWGGYVANDPSSGVFGRMDPGRWEQIVRTFGPLLQSTGALPPGQLPAAASLYSNEFIDPNVHVLSP